MSKDDTAPGLLSKLVKFVRNPATNWTELDSVGGEKNDSVNKELLKEMIERKRRNDFVRKREFDMLRNLRKLEAAQANMPNEASDRPSFFQSSMTSPTDARAVTLKKIDDIEAQMSMQWWKGNNQTPSDKSSRTEPPKAQDASLDSLMPVAYQPTMPAGLDTLAPTMAPAEEPMLKDLLAGLPQAPSKPGKPELRGSMEAWDSGALALSPLLSSEPVTLPGPRVIEHDAELEEAAILFANGDDAAAEAGLLEILALGALRAEHVETWLTLFDLYRVIGEQDKFETSAIEFAVRFGRSAPQWFSLPDMVKAITKPVEKVAQGAAADWICPSVVGMQTVGALNAAISRASMPWRLDWRNLKTIETSALEPLYKVFSHWANHPVQLRFMGDAKLQKVLLDTTPSGERATDQKWWLLRMELLRVIHRPDDFELAALDFCVTYEVSPPAWDSAVCEYKSLDEVDAIGRSTIIGEPSSEPVNSTFNFPMEGDSIQDWLSSMPASRFLSVELSGEIQGHAVAVLDRLEASLTGADIMQISCAKLIRVDFSAAGMLLNWVSARQAEKRSIEFSDVNRLIAAFFNVIGITEYARVVVRND
ncbi:ABC-type transporter Mla MlaB component [Polaromonas sp. CG_9.5]|uniref:STAS domain-containing protein n=1 Tax=Polaromonas sp. CG_9.5 TaxID=3071705 RepID=UPI002DFF6C13|nr:ABC-type transporter Mla MlaB component [Polaromonas sp. CG_9.5]